MNQATRDRTIALLIDEQYDRALAAGQVIRHPDGWRTACRANTEQQAHERPGWIQQQADRLLGDQARPGAAITCPHCGLTINPHDRELVRGADGLAYCRPSCASHEPLVTLDEWLAAHPDATDYRRYQAAAVIAEVYPADPE